MGQNFSSEPVVEKDTERDTSDTFNVAVSSCQGWRTSQEDNHTMMLQLPGIHEAAFFAVFDGHGGARVSRHASESLWRHLTQNEQYVKGNFKLALEQSFLTFDREVEESYNAQLAGTTAVCILIAKDTVYCANIGDSRAVASLDCECHSLSHDHKPENPDELERIILAGGYVLGNRVNGNLALSRAFGDFHYKGNEGLPPEKQVVSSFPDVTSIPLKDNVDFIVLACDGIWDVLTSAEVVEFVISRLERGMEPALICEQLTTRCLASDYELVVGCDNMTVLLVCHTRGRSWDDYCNDIFEKNNSRLGILREKAALESLDLEKNTSTASNTTTTATTTTASATQPEVKFNDSLNRTESCTKQSEAQRDASQLKVDSNADTAIDDPSSSPSSSSTTSTASSASRDANNKTSTTNPTEATITPTETVAKNTSSGDEKTTQENADGTKVDELSGLLRHLQNEQFVEDNFRPAFERTQCNLETTDEHVQGQEEGEKQQEKQKAPTEHEAEKEDKASNESIQTPAYQSSDTNKSEEKSDEKRCQDQADQPEVEEMSKEAPTTQGNENDL